MSGERQWRWDGSNWTYWNGQQWVVGQPEPGEIPGATTTQPTATTSSARGLSGAGITAIVLGALLGLVMIGGGLFLLTRVLGDGGDVVTLQAEPLNSVTATPAPATPAPSTPVPQPSTPAPAPSTPAPQPLTPAPSDGDEALAVEIAQGRFGACGIDVLEADVSLGSVPGVYLVSMYANNGEVYDVSVNVNTGSMAAASQLSAELEFDCPGIFG